METRRRNHPGVAAVLSFFFNGLGQLYNGEILKALLIMALSLACLLVVVISAVLVGFCVLNNMLFSALLAKGVVVFVLSTAAVAVLAVYSIIDAYHAASQ
ncbi:MAG: hypothetical protein PHT59_02340 [Candidatus Omnitrophica bacterium]|nr:hypothetical protein [Candidatus Omnitrophota bacterium]